MNTQKQLFFNSNTFFRNDFPFCIRHMEHTPEDYDDTMRCQREFWKIIYIISGHGNKIINDRKYPMEAGSLFVIHPDDKTTFDIHSEQLDLYNIIFMPQLIANGIKELKSNFGFFSIFGRDFHEDSREFREMLYVLDSTRETEQIVKKIFKEFKKQPPNYRIMITLYLQELLINISRLSSNKAGKYKKKNITLYIEHMIKEHYNEEFNLDTLSEEIEVTKNHMCRLYKEHYGETIMQTLLNKRLTEAEKLLTSTNLPASEICYRCGFNNLSYFYRAFNTKNGISPIEYRKNITLY